MRSVWLFGALALVCGPSCYRLGVFACDDDSDCVDGSKRGTCEATGWCGYPDEGCSPTGRRYDDLAGNGLAGQCVQPDPIATGSESTSDDTGEPVDTDDDTGPPRSCIDADADGFGEGDGCDGPDCDDDNPNTADGCIYLAPDGDDMGDGSRDAPWRTFARAIVELQPGASLVLLAGTYTPDVHGSLFASCADGGAPNGTATHPIFVRAEEERRAHLQTGGAVAGVELVGCSWWRIRGLHVSGGDAAESGGNNVTIRESTDIELRTLLLDRNNRRFGTVLARVPESARVLFEDCEAYAFTGTAFYGAGGTDIVLRRVYMHGRDAEDLPDCESDGQCSEHGDRADYGVSAGSGMLLENVIIERAAYPVAGSGIRDVTLLGVVSTDAVHGLVFGWHADRGYPRNIRIEHYVSIGTEIHATYVRSAADVVIRNVTAIGSSAFRSDLDGGQPCDPQLGCWVEGANLLSVDSVNDGLLFVDTEGRVTHSNVSRADGTAFYPDEVIDDDEGLWQRSSTVEVDDIGLDACIVVVPDGSPMKGAGENGDDIGANLRFRYEGGVLTTTPLWDAETGAFPCGAVVEGVNDDPARSCIGVHERLRVRPCL